MRLPSIRALLVVLLVLPTAACAAAGGATSTPAGTADAGTGTVVPEASPTATTEDAAEPLGTQDVVDRLIAAGHAAGTVVADKTLAYPDGSTGWAVTQVRYRAEGEMDLVASVGLEEGVQTGEVRWVDGAVYNCPGSAGASACQVVTTGTDGADLSATMTAMDPLNPLAVARGAVLSIEEAGEAEEIDGVLAQPYRVVLETAVLAQNAGEGEAGHVAVLPDEVVETWWIDADDLLRRFQGDLVTVAFDTVLSWGGEVGVAAPDVS
jgi:hypothetical protein